MGHITYNIAVITQLLSTMDIQVWVGDVFLFFSHDSLLMDRSRPKAFGAAFRHLLSEFQVKLSVRLEYFPVFTVNFKANVDRYSIHDMVMMMMMMMMMMVMWLWCETVEVKL